MKKNKQVKYNPYEEIYNRLKEKLCNKCGNTLPHSHCQKCGDPLKSEVDAICGKCA